MPAPSRASRILGVIGRAAEGVSRGEEPRQVRERRVLVSRWRRDQQADRISGALFDLNGSRGEQDLRLLKHEFLSIHAGTSQTLPWASNRWPVTRDGS